MASDRFGFSTMLTLTVLTVSLWLANCYGFQTKELPDGSQFLKYGWPTTYLVRLAWSYDYSKSQMVDTPRWAFSYVDAERVTWGRFPNSTYLNAITAAILLGCTWIEMSRRNRVLRSPWQMSLSELLVLMTLASVYMALALGESPGWPLVTWKPLVFFPILLGLYYFAAVLTRLLRGFVSAVSRLRERPTKRFQDL